MAESSIAGLLRPGDLVVVGQGTGEPTELLRSLCREARELPEVEIFVGLSHSGVLAEQQARLLRLVSFGAMGPLAAHAARGSVAILPGNFADVPRLLRTRAPGRLVVCLQVGPADGDARHSLGTAVDYTYELLDSARLVIAEVNDGVPRTSAPTVPAEYFTRTLSSSRPLQVVTHSEPTDVQRQIAEHVAALVPDGATIQLGVGTISSAVGGALRARRGLKVRSTLVGSWLQGLADAGSLADEPGSVCISEAAGSAELYRLTTSSRVHIRPVSEVTRPDELAAIDCFVAMNSALEVDLSGQVNAEVIASGYVAGIGGQADFMRAAQRSASGRSILMLPATTARGQRSRIVSRLTDGIVSTPRASVDFVVTEFGVADLRGRDLDERRAALIEIAHPDHRRSLRAA